MCAPVTTYPAINPEPPLIKVPRSKNPLWRNDQRHYTSRYVRFEHEKLIDKSMEFVQKRRKVGSLQLYISLVEGERRRNFCRFFFWIPSFTGHGRGIAIQPVCTTYIRGITSTKGREMRSFAIDSDRPRVSSQLYSLFRAGSPGERLDQADRGGQPSNWGKIGTGEAEMEGRDRAGGWDGRGRGWKFSRLLEESMSTTVNYDKYRDCDAAIFRGFGTSVSRANIESERFTSFSISFPRAIRHTESSRGSFGHETLAENTVCRPCNAEQADPSPPMSNGRSWGSSRGDLVIASLLVRGRLREINLTIPNFSPGVSFSFE